MDRNSMPPFIKKYRDPAGTIFDPVRVPFCAFCSHRLEDDSQTLKEEMLIQRQRGPAVEANGVLDSQPPHEQQHQGPDDL